MEVCLKSIQDHNMTLNPRKLEIFQDQAERLSWKNTQLESKIKKSKLLKNLKTNILLNDKMR